MFIKDLEATSARLKPFLVDYLQEKGIDTSKNFRCISPSHEDKSPSCSIVGVNTNSPRVYCHGCGFTADIFDVAQIMDKKPAMGLEWVEDTFKFLAKKYNVDFQVGELSDEQLYELDTYRAYKTAASLITTKNLSKTQFKHFHREVDKRAWDLQTLELMNVGTVESYTNFRTALKDAGFTAAFLDEIDLSRKDIFSSENLIFTWKDERGRPIGFTSRNLLYEEQKEAAEAEGKHYDKPKYNNQRTTGLRCNIFQKGKRFYGIDTALSSTPPIYIFEGQTDVITARDKGLHNCVAIAGSTLSADHVELLKVLGIFDVILCLDGDDTGRTKLKLILEEKLSGHKDMKVRVITLPDTEDPDSFIRKNGIQAFKDLACWSAFEWRLNQYAEDDDPTDICRQMIPFIVNESSPVVREDLCKTLVKRTGVSLKAITEELNILLDEKAHERSKERQLLVERAIYELKKDPSNAEFILHQAQTNLTELVKKHDSDILSNEDFVRTLDEMKDTQETKEITDLGFNLGPDLAAFQEILRGEWSKDVFFCFGGKPNVGKSAFLCKIAYSIAKYNEDVIVIYHTIDDTIDQLAPRFITIANGKLNLTMNMVKNPKYWSDELGLTHVNEGRKNGYALVRELGLQGRLVIKDMNHGMSLPFAEHMISYYKDKYPGRRVVYILDNMHKLKDFDSKDERVRFKHLSQELKAMANRHHAAILSSVEYTKLAPGTKPTNHNISESAQIEYDANFIAHLYSEVSDIPDSFNVCHEGQNWKGELVFLPRVEIIIGKNKITEQKLSLFLDFYPASSDYRAVDQATVLSESKVMQEQRKKQMFGGKASAINNNLDEVM